MPRNILRACTAALLLNACTAAPPPAPATPPPAPAVESSACQVGPNGGPAPLADRGIGGTGAPPVALADKGIGGTGIQPADAQKTGVLGVITGFASICVGGEEVAYAPTTPVSIDGQPATPADLRAGQLAAIQATGPGLQAQQVLIRHEVIGPVQSTSPPGLLIVAGQRVSLTPATLGQQPPVGAWVAVSGFRGADGTIAATRIDPAPPNTIELAGTVTADGPTLRIGAVTLLPAPDAHPSRSPPASRSSSSASGKTAPSSLNPPNPTPSRPAPTATSPPIPPLSSSKPSAALPRAASSSTAPSSAAPPAPSAAPASTSNGKAPARSAQPARATPARKASSLFAPASSRTPSGLEPAPIPGRTPLFGAGPDFHNELAPGAPPRTREWPGNPPAFNGGAPLSPGGGVTGPYFGGFGGGNFRPR